MLRTYARGHVRVAYVRASKRVRPINSVLARPRNVPAGSGGRRPFQALATQI